MLPSYGLIFSYFQALPFDCKLLRVGLLKDRSTQTYSTYKYLPIYQSIDLGYFQSIHACV